jgi:hypothetical protein
MFTFRKLWDSLGRLADAVLNLAATLDGVSGEIAARCALPGPAPALAPALPSDGNGQGAEPAKAGRGRKAK